MSPLTHPLLFPPPSHPKRWVSFCFLPSSVAIYVLPSSPGFSFSTVPFASLPFIFLLKNVTDRLRFQYVLHGCHPDLRYSRRRLLPCLHRRQRPVTVGAGMDLSFHIQAPHLSILSSPSSTSGSVESKRCPRPTDLYHDQRFLSGLSSFHTVESWSSSREPVAGQHDPPLRRSPPELPGRRAGLSFGHVLPRPPFGRFDVVRALAVPRPRRRGPTNLILRGSPAASLRSDRTSPSLLALFDTDRV